MSKSDIVNVKMVITEEKILANIEKIEKMINPNSKKQIVNLEEDTYFRDLVESIKTYLIEYPEKKDFPKSVYDAAYNLVEDATNQFEENTKSIESLIRQREKNISMSIKLRDTLNCVESKSPEWDEKVQELAKEDYSQEIIDTLGQIGRARNNKSPNYLEALKIINTEVSNLESNVHIEIDMERIEDKSKALSYIGIEIADALKEIPVPKPNNKVAVSAKKVEQTEKTGEIEKVEKSEIIEKNNKDIVGVEDFNNDNAEESNVEKIETEENIQDAVEDEDTPYYEDTRLEVKPSLWERIKNMKLIRGLRYLFKIKVVLELPSLPEGNKDDENKD